MPGVGVVVILIFILDQLTKYLAVRDLSPYGSLVVIPDFFSLTFVQNKGAAFGMFAGLPTPWRELALGAVSLIALVFVFNMLIKDTRETFVPRLSLALILGGAFGNILDRVRLGSVVDFLDFYVGELHWPAFNVADASICIGVTLLLISMSTKQNRDGSRADQNVTEDTVKMASS